MKEDGGYEVREHRKDDAVSASTLPIGWRVGYLEERIFIFIYTAHEAVPHVPLNRAHLFSQK